MNNREIYRQLESIVRADTWRRERLKSAIEERDTLADQIASSRFTEVLGGQNIEFSDPTSSKAAKLEKLEKFISESERFIEAVDAAYANVGKKYAWDERQEMRFALKLNFTNPKKYPWQKLNYKKGRQHFFMHRRIFLKHMGKELGMYHDD